MYRNERIQNLCRVKFHDERGGVLRLDMNENPEGLPADFVEEIKAQITPPLIAAYPEKDGLVKLIAEHSNIAAGQITLTNGSDEAMSLAFRCFGKPGGKLVSVTPTFEMYGVYAAMNGLEHVTVPYHDDFTIDVDQMKDAIDGDTSIVVMLNPNSPIGAVYSEAQARAIIEKALRYNSLVIVDEAYHYYYLPTFVSLINDYANVLVMRTFSKVCSIAGLRVGYAAGNTDLINVMENAESTFNVNSVGILFAKGILKRPDIIESIRIREAEGRKWLTSRLDEAGYKPLSLEGNFVLFKPNRPSGTVVADLKKYGVWTRDYSKGILSGFLRVSTGGIDVMRRFWECFAEVDAHVDG